MSAAKRIDMRRLSRADWCGADNDDFRATRLGGWVRVGSTAVLRVPKRQSALPPKPDIATGHAW